MINHRSRMDAAGNTLYREPLWQYQNPGYSQKVGADSDGHSITSSKTGL
ncbi:Uncharacterised protein [Providencia rettgeri]|uniref:Uncharacterized protein n=1 Tax=Providencia rettgeri TaxID=587 RepID=A0A379FVT7_PRORE|nr:Uncharacterised protein [Providencia rettgeri]